MTDLFNKLDVIFSRYDSFIIMGHVNPDLDSFGASLALYQRLKSINKQCYIFLEHDCSEYSNLMNKAMCKVDSVNYINSKSNVDFSKMLLVILDVHQKNRLEYPNIINSINDIIILDHHIKDPKYINNTKLTYINSNLSSMIELMTYYLDYCEIKINSNLATIMLAGLEIDTNNYNLKTTSRTYKAASILMEMGADINTKRELLKESKDEFIKRADYIKNSYIINNNVAICILPEISASETLAEVSDELLTFEDVEQSFTIAKLETGKTGVSARSLNNKDVLSVIKKLNGGGNKTNAATSTNQTIEEIINIIEKNTR